MKKQLATLFSFILVLLAITYFNYPDSRQVIFMFSMFAVAALILSLGKTLWN